MLINKAEFVSVLQCRTRCDECDGNVTITFGCRGDINIVCNSSSCKHKYHWHTQSRLKITGEQRGVPAQMYLTATIAILCGSTYESYAQPIKSTGLEAVSPHVFYELAGGKVYDATLKVWNECRKKYVFPHVKTQYMEMCGADEHGIIPLSITADTRWQKRGTGKAYDSLDGTTYACDTYTGYVLSIANQHRPTASGYRERHYDHQSFTQSSHMMDPTGTVHCIEENMTFGSEFPFDIQCGLLDGDGKWVKPAEKLKTKLKENLDLRRNLPHLQHISTSIHQDLCLTHVQKNYIKLLKKTIKQWKSDTKTAKLPQGSGAGKIVHYLQVSFHDVIRKKYKDEK